MRTIAHVGKPTASLTEALREFHYQVEALSGESLVGLARELYRLKPAALHVSRNHLKAASVAKLLNLPIVLEAGLHCDVTSVARAAQMSDRTLCAGASVREALLEQGAPHSSTVVMRSLIDAELGARTFPPMLDPQLRWVVAASPCDGPDRGHADLLAAFIQVARTRPRLKLLIAGEGCDARKLRAQADEAGLVGRVIIHKIAPDQLPAVFARAAVVVGPSRSGSAPDAVPEALAVGAPVIATGLGSHPVWIREGRTGWLVPARAPLALAARLGQVLDDPQLARQAGHSARIAAAEASSPSATAQDLARCYAAIARGPAPQRLGLYLGDRSLSRA